MGIVSLLSFFIYVLIDPSIYTHNATFDIVAIAVSGILFYPFEKE